MKTLLSLFLTATIALADQSVITYVDTGSGENRWTDTLSVPQFNPAIGRLMGVTVVAKTTYNSTLKVENLQTSGATFTGDVKVNLSITSPGVVPFVANSTWSYNRLLSGFDGVGDFGGTSGFTITKAASEYVYLPVINEAAFVGTGNVTFQIGGDGGATINGSGNHNASIFSGGRVCLWVWYVYEDGKDHRCHKGH